MLFVFVVVGPVAGRACGQTAVHNTASAHALLLRTNTPRRKLIIFSYFDGNWNRREMSARPANYIVVRSETLSSLNYFIK